MLDYRSVSPLLVAILVYGLRENSRVKLAVSHQKLPIETILLAGIHDRLSLSLWTKTKDGQKNRNRPNSLLAMLMGNAGERENDTVGFDTGEEFQRRLEELQKEAGKGDYGD